MKIFSRLCFLLTFLGANLLFADAKLTNNHQLSEYDQIAAGLALRSTHADVAILKKSSDSFHVREGHVSTITLTGEQIKFITQLISKKAFGPTEFFVYGFSKGKINQRIVGDQEKYVVVLDEHALSQIFNLESLGALDEDYSVRAPFIEGIYGNITALYFVSGPKILKVGFKGVPKEGPLWKDLINDFLASENKEELTKEFLLMTPAKFKQTFIFEIANIDFGISQNTGNEAYKDYLNKKSFSISRGGVPLFGQLFINSGLKLTYDAGPMETQLTNEIKYLQSDFNKKPEKDKLVFGLNFRAPWERNLFKDKEVVLSPILKNSYETKLAPYIFPNNKEIPKATKKAENLLGFKVDVQKAKMDFEVGALMVTDFNQKATDDKFDFGPGLNINSKWPIFGPLELSTKIKTYYLFPLPQNKAKNKIAMGIEGAAWLRVARFYDFSVSLMSDFLFATLQNEPSKVAASSIFGITLSYGNLFKLNG